MAKKFSRRKKIVIWTAEILFFVLVYLGIRSWLQQDMVEGPAPALDAALLDGSPVQLEQYQGRPVLLYFWASWCGICKLEQGVINSIKKDWPVITIAMQSGQPADIQAYLDEHQLDWRVVPDPEGRLAQRYGVRGVPASFILDENGVIRFQEAGYTTTLGLRARLWAAQGQK
jgi:thiol-disulfide isomerase/thioredoxin